ncbi:LPS export ABC transporter periplasmic protein LptC [Aquamicrobium sp. LC103]|uniref:LPS export ABC transporter periplasmic protein LptC n=1 Tax=Aquamicrobium sp. LC103 TaxID=1120658 RepID=UPI00063EB622|nr:LPS export ABC transporter periplasmic protein LptC [Aquamicrobium sp. LC103]TKT82637.1 LPS export ABC transporter periplasmic protein LptC [Aquamicrobium sp. LC103]
MTRSAVQDTSDPTRAPASAAEDSGIRDAFARARRHSGRVRALKLMLPVAATVLAVAFLAKSYFATPAGVSVDLTGTAIENGRLVMANPKLDGFTRDDRAYTMTADRAIQDIGSGGSIDLEGIDAKLPLNDSDWATVKASRGTYDRNANTLDITSEMTVVTDNGISAALNSATVDIAAGDLKTDKPVRIDLEGTRIDADSMEITNRGKVLIFEQRVRMEIDGNKLQTAARATEGNANEN